MGKLLWTAVLIMAFTCTTSWAGVDLVKVGAYESDQFNAGAAKEAAFDPVTKRLFVVNASQNLIDVLDLSDGRTPKKVSTINLKEYGAQVTSAAFKNGLLAVTVTAETVTGPGQIIILDAAGQYLTRVRAGAAPVRVAFSPDGKYLLAANEGRPNADYSLDPEGTVTIVDLSAGIEQLKVKEADFKALNLSRTELKKIGVRLSHPQATVAQDLEPQSIAMGPESQKAWITLQENSALAVVDLAVGKVVNVLPLGLKNWAGNGWGLDSSDRDGGINFYLWPVSSLHMPDGVAAYQAWGNTYILTANEGASRESAGIQDGVRVGQARLDADAFPNATELQDEAALGRLKAVIDVSDTDDDGDLDRVVTFGARSFSIWDENGEPVYDSGDDFERITADMSPGMFNSDNKVNEFDARSDESGPEPQGVALGYIEGRTYAFIGLARIGGIMVYDISHPAKPKFVEYVNDRHWEGDPESGTAGDLGPAGLLFIPSEASPSGQNLLIVANEISGTVSTYEVIPKGQEPIALGTKLVDRYTLVGEKSFLDGYEAINRDQTVNVVVEIPSGTSSIWKVTNPDGYLKWEYIKGKPSLIQYLGFPANYGIIPRTQLPEELGGDNNPVPVLVLGPTVPRGTVLKTKVIGVLKTVDNGRREDRLIAVQSGTRLYEISDILELNREYPGITTIIETWFANYKGAGQVQVEGYGGAGPARDLILKATETFNNNQ